MVLVCVVLVKSLFSWQESELTAGVPVVSWSVCCHSKDCV